MYVLRHAGGRRADETGGVDDTGDGSELTTAAACIARADLVAAVQVRHRGTDGRVPRARSSSARSSSVRASSAAHSQLVAGAPPASGSGAAFFGAHWDFRSAPSQRLRPLLRTIIARLNFFQLCSCFSRIVSTYELFATVGTFCLSCLLAVFFCETVIIPQVLYVSNHY